jgi:hypothetical protein
MGSGYAPFLQAAIGTVFIVAAVAKAIRGDSLQTFLLAIGLSRKMSGWVSHATPAVEGALGVLLLLGVALPAAVVAAALTLSFCAVLALAWSKGVDKSCGCFGPLETQRLSRISMFRALVLASSALLLSLIWLLDGQTMWQAPWEGSSALSTILGTLNGAGYVVAFSLWEQAWSFKRMRPRRYPAADTVVAS